MYNTYTGPRAFLPHSAINLSVKTPAEVGSSTLQSSLDLSVPEGGSPYLLNPTGGGSVPTGYNSIPNTNNVSSPQILDLTRTTNMIRYETYNLGIFYEYLFYKSSTDRYVFIVIY